MALRLSSYSSATSLDGYMKLITDDTSISLELKNICLKTLAIVLKNLIDSSKGGLSGGGGLKYRTLKLDNPKLKAKLLCCSAVRDLLLDASLVGMIAIDVTLVMNEAPSPAIRDTIGLKVLPAVSTAQKKIASRLETSESAFKKAKLDKQNEISTVDFNKLTEKQKARILSDEKQLLEKEREKAFHKQTKARIAADKLVRLNDPNWKPSVSAAADKTGTGLLSFRDRHGE